MTQLDESHDLLHAENKDRIYQHNKILDKLEQRISKLERVVKLSEYDLDKLEQRISKLEKVLESHAKCIGELRGTELRIHDLISLKGDK
jgi:exonuclease VII small subunit